MRMKSGMKQMKLYGRLYCQRLLAGSVVVGIFINKAQ